MWLIWNVQTNLEAFILTVWSNCFFPFLVTLIHFCISQNKEAGTLYLRTWVDQGTLQQQMIHLIMSLHMAKKEWPTDAFDKFTSALTFYNSWSQIYTIIKNTNADKVSIFWWPWFGHLFKGSTETGKRRASAMHLTLPGSLMADFDLTKEQK